MKTLLSILMCACCLLETGAALCKSVVSQEKIYIQTDKPYYLQGDTVWMKGYLVNAESHRECDVLSRFIYVELINENQQVVLRKKMMEEEGCFRNFFALQDDVPEGKYMLRAYTNFMRNADEEYFFTRQLSVMQRSNSLLSVQVRYEQVAGKRYLIATLLQRNGQPFAGKQVRYMVRTKERNNRHLWRRTNRKGEIRIPIPDKQYLSQYVDLTLQDGQLSLTRRIDIPSIGDYHVGFYPEGGHLLSGVPQVVAFKAEADGGRFPHIKGCVLNQQGDTLAVIASEHEGIGSVVFTANASDSLFAVVTDETGLEKRFALPRARTDKVALQVCQDEHKVHYHLNVPSGVDLQENLLLLAHVRGRVVAKNWMQKHDLAGSFDKKNVPEGMVHLTVFNGLQEAVSERLLFVRHVDPLYQVSVFGSAAEPRSLIKVGVKIMDEDMEQLSGNFALSVTDNASVEWREEADNLRSSLLLTSDLKGRIPTPGYYLQAAAPLVERHTDQLMLTHGWTRFPSDVLLHSRSDQAEIWKPERVQTITGHVRNVLNRSLKRPVVLSVALTDFGKVETVKTQKDGSFCFTHDCPDMTNFVITPSRKRAELYTVTLDEATYPEVEHLDWKLLNRDSNRSAQIDAQPMDYTYAGGEKSYEIPEVTIQGTVDNGEYEYESFTTSMIEQVSAENVLDLLNKMPEVCIYRVRKWMERDKVWIPTGERYIGLNMHEAYIESYLTKGDNFTSTVVAQKGETTQVQNDLNFKGSTLLKEKDRTTSSHQESCIKATVFVDSLEVKDQENLAKLKASDVLYIDFLNNRKYDGNKFEQATPEWENSEEWQEQTGDKLMGDNRQGIVITTKRLMRGRFTESLPHVAHVVPLGYAKQAEFYSPVYATDASKQRKDLDERTTIYWMPQLKFNDKGEAAVSFYTADRPSTYTIVLEGMTREGKACRYVKTVQGGK